MGVDIDEARDDRLAGHVDLFCGRGSGDFTCRVDRGNAVVGDENVAFLKDLVAFHCDNAGTSQQHSAGWFVPSGGDGYVVSFWLIIGYGLAVKLGAPRPGDRFAIACPI